MPPRPRPLAPTGSVPGRSTRPVSGTTAPRRWLCRSTPRARRRATPRSARPRGTPRRARRRATPRLARPRATPRLARPRATPRRARPRATPRSARPRATPRSARPRATPRGAVDPQPATCSVSHSSRTKKVRPPRGDRTFCFSEPGSARLVRELGQLDIDSELSRLLVDGGDELAGDAGNPDQVLLGLLHRGDHVRGTGELDPGDRVPLLDLGPRLGATQPTEGRRDMVEQVSGRRCSRTELGRGRPGGPVDRPVLPPRPGHFGDVRQQRGEEPPLGVPGNNPDGLRRTGACTPPVVVRPPPDH